VLVGDPLTRFTITFTTPANGGTISETVRQVAACHPGTISFNVPPLAGTQTETSVGHSWTYGQGLSPAGIKLNFLPRRRFQPVFTASGGYILTTQPVPISTAGSANFTFEIGAGLEIFHSATKSLRAGYRYNHISNNYTAMDNPGIDNGILQITWSFGR
jgi:opacity protein-like surface antigen